MKSSVLVDQKKKTKNDFQIWYRGVTNVNYKRALEIYCDKNSHIIRACSSKLNTNGNEALNASIGMFASKRIDYRKSYSARCGLAIGKRNDSFFVKKVLDKVFKKGELSPFVYDAMLNLEIEKKNSVDQLNTIYQKKKKKESANRREIKAM